MYSSMWIPGEEVVGHQGMPLAEDDDFFVAPPPEIGRVFSASTTLKTWAEPTASAAFRVRAVAIAGGAVALFFWLLSFADWRPDQIGAFRQIAAASILLSALIPWLGRKPHYVCSYVGASGVARFRCWGWRGNIISSNVFLFDRAACLKTSVQNIYVNFAFLHTHYSFRWHDISGALVYQLSGTHRNYGAGRPVEQPYHLAEAAQRAWAQYLLPMAYLCLDRGEALTFRCGRGRSIELGEDHLALGSKRFDLSDLDVCVEQGQIVFRRIGDKRAWYRLDRAPRVRYAHVENAWLLLCLLAEAGSLSEQPIEIAGSASYHLLHAPH